VRYSQILVENRRFNLPHLYLAPPFGVTPLEFCRDLWHQKTRRTALSYGIKISLVGSLDWSQNTLVTDGENYNSQDLRRAVKMPHLRRTWTVQSYSSGCANVHPYLIHASLATKIHMPNDISMGSAVFAELMADSPYTSQCAAPSPFKAAHLQQGIWTPI